MCIKGRYQAPELQNILRSCAEVAIAGGTCEKGVLDFCAALAARDSGSARQALDFLWLADEHAENKDDERIAFDHVDIARQKPEQRHVVEGMRELAENGHSALLAVVLKAARDKTPCRMHDLYQEYLRLCSSAGTDLFAQRSAHNHLSDLWMLGILSTGESQTGSYGNYYSYAPDVPFPSAMEVLSDVPALDLVLDEIRKTATQTEAA